MPTSCPRCGTETAEENRFCPNCGLEVQVRSGDTAVEPLPPDETGRVPVTVVRAEPGLVRVLATVSSALRASSLGRETARAVDRALAGMDVVIAGLKARSRVERELLGLRREVRGLSGERERALRDLGEAVYGNDERATGEVKQRIGALDESIEEKRKAMETILEQVESEVRNRQLQVQPTRIQPPQQPDVPEQYPPPGELDPPQHPDIPEPYPPPGEADPPAPPQVPEPYPGEPDTA